MEIFVTDKFNKQVVNICEKIALQNNTKNGGTLHFEGLVAECSDYLVFAVIKGQIVGYISLSDHLDSNGLYIAQMAVTQHYQHQGVGTQLMDYTVHHLKGYKFLTSDVDNTNTASNKLQRKFGMVPDIRHYRTHYSLKADSVSAEQKKLTKNCPQLIKAALCFDKIGQEK